MTDAIKHLEENLWAFWAHFGKPEGGELTDTPDEMWFETPIAALPYNGILRARVAGDIEAVLDRHFDHFAEQNKPFFWLLHPTATPPDLGERLNARGFAEIERIEGMVAPLNEIAPDGEDPAGAEIREVKDHSDVDELIDFVMWRWQVPDDGNAFVRGMREALRLGESGSPARSWMAWKDGKPVAKAITMETEGAIGLYAVATRPEARGLGLGRAVCLRALHESDGGRGLLGVLHSTPMAVSLYEKMGFKHVAPFGFFAKPDGFHI